MLSNESISATGEVSIILKDKDGNIKETRTVPNLVVTSGKNHIAARIAATYILWVSGAVAPLNTLYYYGNNVYKCTTAGTFTTVAPSHTTGAVANGTATLTWFSFNDSSLISHLGFGTSTTTPALTDTNLFATLGARTVVVLSHSAASNSIIATANYIVPSGAGITEAGLFNALTGGTMICRTTFGTVSVNTSDVLSISWTLKIN
jgi:hypothetical protein